MINENNVTDPTELILKLNQMINENNVTDPTELTHSVIIYYTGIILIYIFYIFF
jgi:hypothetical protein